MLPAPTLLAYGNLKKNLFSSPLLGFFDGQYPTLTPSDVNFVVTDIILWREVTEKRVPIFRILKYFNRFQNIFAHAFKTIFK